MPYKLIRKLCVDWHLHKNASAERQLLKLLRNDPEPFEKAADRDALCRAVLDGLSEHV